MNDVGILQPRAGVVSPAGEASARAAHLPALTGIRAFAALLVLLLHTRQNFPISAADLAIIQRGYLGVDLFFVLSGYIISHVYLRHMARPRIGALRVFLWHRLIRLAPVHIVVLCGLILLVAAVRHFGLQLNEPQSWSLADLPWHFLMLHAWGTVGIAGWNAPSWSISAEMFAYLLFPLIAAALLRLPRAAALAAGLAAFAATALAFAAFGWSLKSAWLGAPALVRVAGEFALGAFLYRALQAGGNAGRRPRLADTAAVLGLVGFAASAQLAANDFVLVGLLTLMLIGVAGGGALSTSVFAARPVVWLGEISYSIYLVHFPVLAVMRKGAEAAMGGPPSPTANAIAFALSLGAVVLAAALLFHAVEKPMRTRLRDVAGTLDPRPMPHAQSRPNSAS